MMYAQVFRFLELGKDKLSYGRGGEVLTFAYMVLLCLR